MKRIVILGGGTGGTITANRLRRAYDSHDAEIVVVDRTTRTYISRYQPALLFVPIGLAACSPRGTSAWSPNALAAGGQIIFT